jgi:hypothetical protein
MPNCLVQEIGHLLPVHVLGNVDHDKVFIFDCRDPDDGDACDGGAITLTSARSDIEWHLR